MVLAASNAYCHPASSAVWLIFAIALAVWVFFSVYSAQVYFTPCLWLLFFSIQKFYGYVEQTESWLSSKEAFLANEDLGVGAPRN